MSSAYRILVYKFCWLISMIAFCSAALSAQTMPIASTSEIVEKAARQRLGYLNEFKNLISKETKIFEIFDKKGQVKKRRVVNSVFIVFEPPKSGSVVEFRNVTSVDGRQIADADKRAEDFFARVAAIESSRKELDQLRNESSRYDNGDVFDGLTLFQAVALADNLRPDFEFEQTGREFIDGRETIVLDFRQLRQSSFIGTDASGEPPVGKMWVQYESGIKGDNNARISGKLWLDSATFQVVRERRQFTIQPAGRISPSVLATNEFDYVTTPFGIYAPKRIAHTQYGVGEETAATRPRLRATFEYEAFTRPDVEVKGANVKSSP